MSGQELGAGRLSLARLRCRRWQIWRSTPDYVLLGADSRIGLPGQLLFQRQADRLLFCTFVQQANPIARTVWASIEAAHVKTVRRLLEQGSQRCRP